MATVLKHVEQASTETKKMAPEYPKKYWWLVLIVVPLAVAVLPLVNRFIGGKKPELVTVRTDGGDTYVYAPVSFVHNEYQEKHDGQEFDDSDIASRLKDVDSALNDGDFNHARELLQPIAEQLQLPSLFNNLGILEAMTGRPQTAKDSFDRANKAAGSQEYANHNQGTLKKTRVSVAESEPNNETSSANVIELGRAIDAAIETKDDVDCFSFTNDQPLRDWFMIKLTHRSTTLMPDLELRDDQGTEIANPYKQTPGADIEYWHVFEARREYFVLVSAWYASSGKYTIELSAGRRYDAYEPNDSLLTPTPMDVGATLDANILDGRDVDHYVLSTGTYSGELKLFVENLSDKLMPSVGFRNQDKEELWSDYSNTPGANMRKQLTVSAAQSYYIVIQGYFRTSGPYRLSALTP